MTADAASASSALALAFFEPVAFFARFFLPPGAAPVVDAPPDPSTTSPSCSGFANDSANASLSSLVARSIRSVPFSTSSSRNRFCLRGVSQTISFAGHSSRIFAYHSLSRIVTRIPHRDRLFALFVWYILCGPSDHLDSIRLDHTLRPRPLHLGLHQPTDITYHLPHPSVQSSLDVEGPGTGGNRHSSGGERRMREGEEFGKIVSWSPTQGCPKGLRRR